MANDLSFNIIALDRASETFVKVAEQLDRLSLKLDELDHKNVDVTVDVKTDKSQQALTAFGGQFNLMAAGIIAGAPAIGAGLLAGVGLGFAGIAVLAQKNNAQVAAGFEQLKLDVVGTMRSATDQVVPYITEATRTLDTQLASLGPQLHAAFAGAGPDLQIVSSGLGQMVGNLMPGLINIMRESQPVVAGTATLFGSLGTTASDALTAVSQHSRDYGQVVTSLGPLTHDAVGAVTGIVNDLAVVWARNGAQIDSTVSTLTHDLTDLATGATHMLSAGFGGMLGTANLLLGALRPIAPELGAIGGAALPVIGSFRLFTALGGPLGQLGNGIGNLGSKMSEADGIAGRLSGSVSNVGTAVSKFGSALPYLGAGITAAIALEQAFGTTSDQLAQDLLQGGTQAQFAAKHIGGMAPLLGSTLSQLSGTAKAQALYNYDVAQFGPNSAQAAAALKIYGLESQKAAQEQKTLADAAAAGVTMLPAVASAASTAAGAVTMFGGSLGTAAAAANAFAAANPAATIGDIFNATVQAAVKVPDALQGITDHFTQTQAAVTSAAQSLADAQHSYAQSAQAVTDANAAAAKSAIAVQTAETGVVDADHQLLQAHWAVSSAEQGVTTAERALAQAQADSRQAQLDLTAARAQAAQQLRDLHLQLTDQVNAEESARLQLEQARATQLGVAVTTLDPNYDARTKALGVADAQAHLNDTLSQGAQLRAQVATADAKGVEGSDLVVAAQQKVQQTAQAVASAQDAVVRSQQSLTTATWALQKAYDGVSTAQRAVVDARDAEVKAHQAVADAMYNRQKAAQAVTTAEQTMTDATAKNSTTLDINTAAGRTNLTMLGVAVQAILDSHEPIANQITDLFNAGQQFFHNTDLTSGWITKILQIPPSVQFNIKGVAQLDMIQLEQSLYPGATPQSLAADLARLDPNNPNFIRGAAVHAAGGAIGGVGGPTDDANLIWASRGEYMQPADAVDYYGMGAMESLRRRQVPRTALTGFAGGGLIGAAKANDASLLLSGYYGGLGSGYEAGGRTKAVFGYPFTSLASLAPVIAFTGTLLGLTGGGGGGGQIAYSGPGGVAQWAPQILQALGMLGQPSSWLGTVERRMNQESGGNPTVVNRWDSNWARGTPSVGLMQVIGPTYRAYAGPFGATGPFEYGTSVNPLANVYAGLNYALHRYGSLSALNRPGGYDTGGWLPAGGTGVNSGGQPEAVLTPDESAAFKRLAAHAASTGGAGSTVTVNVYPQPGASPAAIADDVVRHLTHAMR